MQVLGIDPGTATMGFGVVAVAGTTLVPVTYGVIRTPASQPPAQRLAAIYRDLQELLRRYQPQAMAVERLFLQKNRSSALHVGQARGVALLAAAQAGLPVHEYAPHEVKQAVVGYGRASKVQVQRMVQALLGLARPPVPDDAADALAVAVCCLHAQTSAWAGTGAPGRGGSRSLPAGGAAPFQRGAIR
ncbi:crossover junction endodeoxyribonuclease RuvC [Thermaerobacter sp. PB12/4term]|uniref:crossover junction endodeoxyribonuclease RuvC n=1 Tax=Thermaerobacter sp. PB12/4term TaxID=2293838 RepID=UPI000E32C009|nr:crossover junction endodeoxyribonuclease RuvC [Thermaerobacter sp. PB12/4term]QIA26827.1 crossover junction endodeoxyribonuclease RuvC [Thermaerobacter sp. PB12/4term]